MSKARFQTSQRCSSLPLGIHRRRLRSRCLRNDDPLSDQPRISLWLASAESQQRPRSGQIAIEPAAARRVTSRDFRALALHGRLPSARMDRTSSGRPRNPHSSGLMHCNIRKLRASSPSMVRPFPSGANRFPATRPPSQSSPRKSRLGRRTTRRFRTLSCRRGRRR
jgi:hypothetical protein